ncbi:hypothetical protein [Nocardiopsis sp. CC223A]|uniref:hypothetical protein n=1 Tax=Nocardiopsis sp. CC223A TaxID=3044051 RepID=UPI00278BEEB6|nr:hypothetical protein [Nocardiopsis sp. CC223A]
MSPLTEDEVRELLAPGEDANDLLLVVLAALRRAGHRVDVTDAYGVGSEAAAELNVNGGRRMRITAQPW